MSNNSIPGYDRGAEDLQAPPITMVEFDRLKQSVMFTDEDVAHLQAAGDVLEPQIDEILDLWYGFVGDHDFLFQYFANAAGTPDEEYLDRVRARFGQWIRDTCDAPYDEEWLAYQFEIGRRHHRSGKNQTDNADAVPHIDIRYIIAFIYPITATIREFLANGDHSEAEVDAMYHAWFKSVVLQVTLWSQPYVQEGDW